MKLVFYSGGQNPSNQRIHRELVRMTGKASGVKMTYIPFCEDGAGVFFKRAVKRYRRFGVSRFFCLPLDLPGPISAGAIKKAFSSDIIYLAGGNTYYFLHWLKKRRLLGKLRAFVERGGVLAGLSAGAHIMTPHIRLAGLRGLDPDRNEVGLKSLSALGLVDFEFLAHFSPNSRNIRTLRAYSKKITHPIYVCSDGGGIVIDGNQFSVYGKMFVFYRGDYMRLT